MIIGLNLHLFNMQFQKISTRTPPPLPQWKVVEISKGVLLLKSKKILKRSKKVN